MTTETLEPRSMSDRPLEIRPATLADVPALLEMVNAAYRISEGHVFPGTDRVERTDALKRLDGVAVAAGGGALAACVHIELNGRAAHFGMLATAPARQGRGVGSMLIDYAESLARAGGCGVMRIEVVREAGRVPFYERRGYHVTREHDGQTWNGGADWGAALAWHMVEMEKAL
jgi:GNAT superfamily N-acetyltransferase